MASLPLAMMMRLVSLWVLLSPLFLTPKGQIPPPVNHTAHSFALIRDLIGDFGNPCLPTTTPFGVLILVPQNIDSPAHMVYQPHDVQGAPLINDQFPVSPKDPYEYGNYLVARPSNGQRSEELLLQHLPGLWNAFLRKNGNQPPRYVILFSWIIPCKDCVELIRQTLTQAPYSQVQRHVIHSKNTGQGGDLRLLGDVGIIAYRFRCSDREFHNSQSITQNGYRSLSSGNSVCKISGCTKYDSYKFCYTEAPNYYSWEYCCYDTCGKRGYSYDWCYAGPTSSYWAYCNPDGVYSWKTVKGKECHPQCPCGHHGFSYNWCYTDEAKNWNYCCRHDHPCGHYGYSYLWCYTGASSWQYCTKE